METVNTKLCGVTFKWRKQALHLLCAGKQTPLTIHTCSDLSQRLLCRSKGFKWRLYGAVIGGVNACLETLEPEAAL